jgi:hypothetical protein
MTSEQDLSRMSRDRVSAEVVFGTGRKGEILQAASRFMGKRIPGVTYRPHQSYMYTM